MQRTRSPRRRMCSLRLPARARHADMTNYSAWVGTPAEFEYKTRILERHCQNVGRDPDEITKTWAAFVFIDERQEDADRTAKSFYTNQSRTSELRGLIGTPENIAQSLHEYVDRSATHFILSFLGGDFEKEATLFMDEVVPSCKQSCQHKKRPSEVPQSHKS